MAKGHTCPKGSFGLVVLEIFDDESSLDVFVPDQEEALDDFSDFFLNVTLDGEITGIDLYGYLDGILSRIENFELNKDEAAELISNRLRELKHLQSGGFLNASVVFEISDYRS